MRKRPTHKEVSDIVKIQDKTFLMRIEHTRKNKSEDFTMAELEKVLKNLKNDKSKDFNGYINELFKEGVAGKYLKHSLLMMFNQMKNELVIPDALEQHMSPFCTKRNAD